MPVALQRFLYHRVPGGRRLLRLLYWPRRRYHAWREALQRRRHPELLDRCEARTFSQHGEDGVLAEIFRRLNVSHGYFVEFGVEHGRENNTLALARQGWRGLWLERVPQHCEHARAAIATHAAAIVLLERFVTRENILDLLASQGVPDDLDLLSIDVDGNDYWIAERILERYHPKVLVVEYNAFFARGEDFVIDYAPDFRWDQSNYFGASLKTFTSMMQQHGYALVGCERAGVNAFFVRRDLARGRFHSPADPVAFFYRAPKYGLYWGHPSRAVVNPGHHVTSGAPAHRR